MNRKLDAEVAEKERLRQLDCLIAEKLMGYREKIEVAQGRSMKTAVDFRPAFKVNPDRFSIGSFARHFTRDGTKIYCGKPHELHYPPHYSSSIESAMEVLEKLVSQKMMVTMDNRDSCWRVTFEENAVFCYPSGESKSLPEAICLAALAAVKKNELESGYRKALRARKRLCRHCGKPKWDHSAISESCPIGQKHRTLGYCQYNMRQSYEPKANLKEPTQ